MVSAPSPASRHQDVVAPQVGPERQLGQFVAAAGSDVDPHQRALARRRRCLPATVAQHRAFVNDGLDDAVGMGRGLLDKLHRGAGLDADQAVLVGGGKMRNPHRTRCPAAGGYPDRQPAAEQQAVDRGQRVALEIERLPGTKELRRARIGEIPHVDLVGGLPHRIPMGGAGCFQHGLVPATDVGVLPGLGTDARQSLVRDDGGADIAVEPGRVVAWSRLQQVSGDGGRVSRRASHSLCPPARGQATDRRSGRFGRR